MEYLEELNVAQFMDKEN